LGVINIKEVRTKFDNIKWKDLINAELDAQFMKHYQGTDWQDLYDSIKNKGFDYKLGRPVRVGISCDGLVYMNNGNHRIRVLKELYKNDYIIECEIGDGKYTKKTWDSKVQYLESLH